MTKLIVGLLNFIFVLGAFTDEPKAQRIENWKIFENAQSPTLSVVIEKKEYFLGEAIPVRLLLKNEHETKIPIHEKALYQSSLSAGASISDKEKGYSEKILSIASGGTDWGGFGGPPTYLEPGESVIGDFIIGSVAIEPGKYYIRSSYYWRECNPNREDGIACTRIYANAVEIKISEPKGEEIDAFKYIKIPYLLNLLQSPIYDCTPVCSYAKDVPCEDTPEFYISQAQKFLEHFPKSAYARYINYTMAVMLKDQKRFADAETQMGKFISLYPGDWMVDDAMFEMAECQLEQGQAAKAQATLESLLQKYPLTSAHMAKRVLENLKKGYRTMDQVYSH